MKVYKNPLSSQLAMLTKRPVKKVDELSDIILPIFDKVRKEGDNALYHYTKKYDGVAIDSLLVSTHEIEDSKKQISNDLKASIMVAISNIEKFHKAQIPEVVKEEIKPGITCWQTPIPIEKVGLYIPGGTAPLFSTVLMLAIPAKIAGCGELVLVSPPERSTGKIHPAVLFAADVCGVDRIFKVGGAQAIAGLTLGTESIPVVNKIFGPGNQYVTAAKQYSFQLGTGIDMPAGPSEVLVYADETANPQFVASDLLSQAEHGVDSQVVLVANNEKIVNQTVHEVEKQLLTLPRQDIARGALENSYGIVIPDVVTAYDYINAYAPEHLIIASDRAKTYLSKIINAGSVFVGNYSPESAGDYASGTNHTLPTAGAAKAFSGVNLDAFYKKITFQELSKEGLSSIAKSITIMARSERLEAHARAVDVRIKSSDL